MFGFRYGASTFYKRILETETAVSAALLLSERNQSSMNQSVAYLSNQGRYTVFTYRDKTIRFITSKNLEKYVSVLRWDNGYLVVESKNFNKEPEENYIDLNPILDNLLIERSRFLSPIKEVRLGYARE